MQQLLLAFTIDLITYSIFSFMHSLYLIFVGFIGAIYIFYKVQAYYAANNYDYDLVYGWRCLLFGTLLGTVGYFAGNITKNVMSSVMQSLGFMSQELNPHNTEAITHTDGSFTNTITAQIEYATFDYKKFLILQNNW